MFDNLQKEPTREFTILDLYLTNKPGLEKNNTIIPGISNHNMVVVDLAVKPVINRKQPKSIFTINKADWIRATWCVTT